MDALKGARYYSQAAPTAYGGLHLTRAAGRPLVPVTRNVRAFEGNHRNGRRYRDRNSPIPEHESAADGAGIIVGQPHPLLRSQRGKQPRVMTIASEAAFDDDVAPRLEGGEAVVSDQGAVPGCKRITRGSALRPAAYDAPSPPAERTARIGKGRQRENAPLDDFDHIRIAAGIGAQIVQRGELAPAHESCA